MGTQHIISIANADLDHDQIIYDFTTDPVEGALPLALMSWSGDRRQLYLAPQANGIKLNYTGMVATEDYTEPLNVPAAGEANILTPPNGQAYFFSIDGKPYGHNALTANQDYLTLSNCSLFLPKYTKGTVFDLRCSFIGHNTTTDPTEGAGSLLIMFTLDYITLQDS